MEIIYLLAKEITFKYKLIVMINMKCNSLEEENTLSHNTVINMSQELSFNKLLLLLYYQLIHIEMETKDEWLAARK